MDKNILDIFDELESHNLYGKEVFNPQEVGKRLGISENELQNLLEEIKVERKIISEGEALLTLEGVAELTMRTKTPEAKPYQDKLLNDFSEIIPNLKITNPELANELRNAMDKVLPGYKQAMEEVDKGETERFIDLDKRLERNLQKSFENGFTLLITDNVSIIWKGPKKMNFT